MYNMAGTLLKYVAFRRMGKQSLVPTLTKMKLVPTLTMMKLISDGPKNPPTGTEVGSFAGNSLV